MNTDSQAQSMRRPPRWPLVAQPGNRSSDWTRDARLVNAWAEKDPNTGEWQVQKRLGFTSIGAYATYLYGRGMYSWVTTGGANINNFPVLMTVQGNNLGAATLYENGAALGAAGGLTDNTVPWVFAEMQETVTPALVISNRTSAGVYYTSGGAPAAAAMPAAMGNTVAGLAWLDGTMYAMDQNCQIFGSNINDPSTWAALNIIIAQKVPGIGMGLVKQLSYIIALKSASMEVFYDAANPTGSPLSQIDGATNDFGCFDQYSIQVLDGVLFYISSNRGSSPQVVRVDNLTPTVISTPAVERLLKGWGQPATTFSTSFKCGGHSFYIITNSTMNNGTGLTLVYDITQNLWGQWTDYQGKFFPFISSGVQGGAQMIQHISDGNKYEFGMSADFPTDWGNVAPVDIYTPTTDFGTRRHKTLHRIYIRSDQTPGSLLYVRRSDDDMKSWSNFRKLDLGRKEPSLNGEGTFVKRAYHFRHSAPTDFRIRSADLQMDFGTI